MTTKTKNIIRKLIAPPLSINFVHSFITPMFLTQIFFHFLVSIGLGTHAVTAAVLLTTLIANICS